MNNLLPPLFYKSYRSVHQHEGWTTSKSITAGGVARQDANSITAGGVATQDSATEKAKCKPLSKTFILL